MIVEERTNYKKDLYKVKIDGKEYIMSSNTILKYHLAIGHEITKEELEEALLQEDYSKYYDKAIDYSLKYAKGEVEVKNYLLKKNVPYKIVLDIINRMKEAKVLNDDSLVESLVESLVRNGNGRLLIKAKLKEKGYDASLIECHLDDIDIDIYMASLNKLYQKALIKYSKYDSYNKIIKIKKYLLSRGYTNSEIDKLSIN